MPAQVAARLQRFVKVAIWRAARAAAVIAILALFLMKGRSRVAALLLLLVSLGEATVTVLNRLGATSQGGANVFLAVIMVIAAFRAVEATFRLRGKLAAPAGYVALLSCA